MADGVRLVKEDRNELVRFAADKMARRYILSDIGQEFLAELDLAYPIIRAAVIRKFPLSDMQVLAKYEYAIFVPTVTVFVPHEPVVNEREYNPGYNIWFPLAPFAQKAVNYFYEHRGLPRWMSKRFEEEIAKFAPFFDFDPNILEAIKQLHLNEEIKGIMTAVEDVLIKYDSPKIPETLNSHLAWAIGLPLPKTMVRNYLSYGTSHHLPILFKEGETNEMPIDPESVRLEEKDFTDLEWQSIIRVGSFFKAVREDANKVFCAYKSLIHKKRTWEDLIKFFPEAEELAHHRRISLVQGPGCPLLSVREAEAMVLAEQEAK